MTIPPVDVALTVPSGDPAVVTAGGAGELDIAVNCRLARRDRDGTGLGHEACRHRGQVDRHRRNPGVVCIGVHRGDHPTGRCGAHRAVGAHLHRDPAVVTAGGAGELDIAVNDRLARSHLDSAGPGHETCGYRGQVDRHRRNPGVVCSGVHRGDHPTGRCGGHRAVGAHLHRDRTVGIAGRTGELDIAVNDRLARSHLHSAGPGHEIGRHIGKVYILGHHLAPASLRAVSPSASTSGQGQ